jgi:hypothetical protein
LAASCTGGQQRFSDEAAQSFQIDLFRVLKVIADHAGNQSASAFMLLCSLEPALQLDALFFGRQVQKRIGHPDRNLAYAHSLNQLTRAATLDSTNAFISGCTRHRETC